MKKFDAFRVEYFVTLLLLMLAMYFTKMISNISQLVMFVLFWWIPDVVTFPLYAYLNFTKQPLGLGHKFYNLVHNFVFVEILAIISFLFYRDLNLLFIGAWFSHILVDRSLGFGLKNQNEKVPSRALALLKKKFS